MFYDTLSENTVKITLTSRDMSDYDIARESLLDRSAESRRSLTRFLKRFQSENSLFTGKSADRLFLEAFPSADGGCVMYVSTLGTGDLSGNDAPDTPVTLMCGPGPLADIARFGTAAAGISSCSSLYRVSGGWCLVVTAKPAEADRLTRLAAEYGELSDDSIDIASIGEHGTLICRGNAAEALSVLV